MDKLMMNKMDDMELDMVGGSASFPHHYRPLSMSSPVSLLFTHHTGAQPTACVLCFVYICRHSICATVMATRTRATRAIMVRKRCTSPYHVQFHIVHLVHELFHFIFLLTSLSVVFAFCSLYPRKQKVCSAGEKNVILDFIKRMYRQR